MRAKGWSAGDAIGKIEWLGSSILGGTLGSARQCGGHDAAQSASL